MKLKLFALLMLLATVGLWSFWCAPVLCAEYYKVYLQRKTAFRSGFPSNLNADHQAEEIK